MLLNCCCDEEVVCRPPPHPEGECPWSSWEHLAGASPLRWHRGCCRPGIGDVSLTTPPATVLCTYHPPPPAAPARLSPPSSTSSPTAILSGGPVVSRIHKPEPPPPCLSPPPNARARNPPAPSARTALYRTHVRAAPIRPPRGPGQTHPHVLSPSGLPRAAWEASLFTFSL